jgi:cysteine desulfurase
MKEIYFDHAATTYLLPEVKKEMEKFWEEQFGNPSALYSQGMIVAQSLAQARGRVGKILNCSSQEIVFVGSGTESDNLAIQGVAKAHEVGEIIVSSIEHDAVLNTAKYLETLGWVIKYVPVDKDGLIDSSELAKLVTDKTVLVSIMYANNEIGTIEPIAKLVEAVKDKNPKTLFHTDACQAGPYLDLDVARLGVDLLTLNGSKVYGPKGTGILYIKKGTSIKPLIYGGGQEFNIRSGTENIPGIMGLAKALEIAYENIDQETERLTFLRDKLIKGLQVKIERVNLNGHPEQRLPNNINLTFEDIEGEAMLLHLNEQGVMASTGSACASNSLDVSHVLKAIGLPYELIHGSVRFTLGKRNTDKDIDFILKIMPDIVAKLRAISPVHLDGCKHPSKLKS